MIITDEVLLDEFRTPGHCELCGCKVRRREPHHIFTKGSGRLDVRLNLLAVCPIFSCGCNCHYQEHFYSRYTRLELIAIAAKREGVPTDTAEAILHTLRRLPKDATDEQISRALSGGFIE
jgi:hypothetical protein